MGAITNYKFKVTNTGTIDAIDTVLDFDTLNVSLAAVSIVGGAELVAGIDGRVILPLVAAGDSLEVMVSLFRPRKAMRRCR